MHVRNYLDECSKSHEECVLVVPSQDLAKTMWKTLPSLPNCPCWDLILRKGISIGWKLGNRRRVMHSMRMYLESYWKNMG